MAKGHVCCAGITPYDTIDYCRQTGGASGRCGTWRCRIAAFALKHKTQTQAGLVLLSKPHGRGLRQRAWRYVIVCWKRE